MKGIRGTGIGKSDHIGPEKDLIAADRRQQLRIVGSLMGIGRYGSRDRPSWQNRPGRRKGSSPPPACRHRDSRSPRRPSPVHRRIRRAASIPIFLAVPTPPSRSGISRPGEEASIKASRRSLPAICRRSSRIPSEKAGAAGRLKTRAFRMGRSFDCQRISSIGGKRRPVVVHDADDERPLEVARRIPGDAGQSPEERIPFGKGRDHDRLFDPLDRCRNEGSLRRDSHRSGDIFRALRTFMPSRRAIRADRFCRIGVFDPVNPNAVSFHAPEPGFLPLGKLVDASVENPEPSLPGSLFPGDKDRCSGIRDRRNRSSPSQALFHGEPAPHRSFRPPVGPADGR